MLNLPLHTVIPLPGLKGRPDRRLLLCDALEQDGVTYAAALPEGETHGRPLLLQVTTDDAGALQYRLLYSGKEELAAQFRHRNACFMQLQQVDALEVRNRLYHCISVAYAGSGWDDGTAPDCKLLDPVRSVRQLHRAVNWAFDRYGAAIEPGRAAGRCYLVNVNEYSFHPAFLITTLFVLLLAGAKILLRYPGERWNYFDPDAFLDELIKVSPGVEPVPPTLERERDYLHWVNTEADIDRIVDLGDAANMYHRYLRYTHPFHAPTTRMVWGDYADNQALQDDKLLQEYGDRCYACCCDYEAFYNAAMSDLHTIDTYAGMDYEICTPAQFLDELRRNADNPLFRDKVQLVVFTDAAGSVLPLPPALDSRVVRYSRPQLDGDDLLYDFTQLLAQ